MLPDGRVVFTNTYRERDRLLGPEDGLRRYAYTGGAPKPACSAATATSTSPIARPPAAGSRRQAAGLHPARVARRQGRDRRDPGRRHHARRGERSLLRPRRPALLHRFRRLGAPRPGTTPAASASSTATARRISWRSSTTPIPTASSPRRTAHRLGRVLYPEDDPAPPRRRKDGDPHLPADHIPDGFKIDIAGNFWVTTVTSGGIDIVSRDGAAIDFLDLDAVPLNCVFDGTRSMSPISAMPTRPARR